MTKTIVKGYILGLKIINYINEKSFNCLKIN